MPTPQQEQENLNKVNAVDESFIKIRPTLLIGLGGTGGDVLLRIRRRFCERYGSLQTFPIVSYLWIDTDTSEKSAIVPPQLQGLTNFADTEKVQATVSDTSAITDNFHKYSGIERWWYPGLNKLGSVTEGAGQIRAYSRMAFFVNYETIKAKLNNAFAKISDSANHRKISESPELKALGLNDRLQFDFSKFDVVIVSSIAGGTGSGMLLDLAFLVKECLHDVQIIGHLIFPGHFGSVVGSERMTANAYALIKELDYYQYGDHNFEAYWNNRECHAVSVPAFNLTYIYDSVNSSNQTNRDPDKIFDLLAESIFKDFTHGSFADSKRSIRCNMAQFTNTVWKTNLGRYERTFCKRYNAAGFSSIIMPHHRIQTACAYRLAADTVDSWGGSKVAEAALTEAAGLCADGREKMRIVDSANFTEGRHDLLMALVDPNVESNPDSGRSNGLPSRLQQMGQRLINDIKSKPANSQNSGLIRKNIEDELKKMAKAGDSTTWGEYSRTIYDNAEQLIKRLCGSGEQVGAIRDWALGLTRQGDKSLVLVRAALQKLSEELSTLAQELGRAVEATAKTRDTIRKTYENHLKELIKSEKSTFFFGDRQVAIDTYTKNTIAESFGLDRQRGFLFYELRLMVLSECIRILNKICECINGCETAHIPGVINEFKMLDDAIVSFSKRLRDRANFFAQKEECHHSLVLYETSDFDSIYSKYVTGPEIFDQLTRNVFSCPGYGVMELRTALRQGNAGNWETLMVQMARPFFADIPKDYHVIDVFFKKFPNESSWTSQIDNYLRLSGFWAQKSDDGQAYVMQEDQISGLVALPKVPDSVSSELADSINNNRRKLENYLKQQVSDKVNGVSECDEIIFYREAGGFPVNYLSALVELRRSYVKFYSNNECLHIDRNDHIFPDPALLSAVEQQAVVDARRAFVFGVALSIIQFLEPEKCYRYVDASCTPPAPILLKNEAQALSRLISDPGLCKKVIADINSKLRPLYTKPNTEDLSRWFSFLALLYRDSYGDKWGTEDYLTLEFNTMLQIQIVKQEQQRTEEVIKAACGAYWKMIKDNANQISELVAEIERPYSAKDPSQNPYPKRYSDGKRVLGHSPTACAEAAAQQNPYFNQYTAPNNPQDAQQFGVTPGQPSGNVQYSAPNQPGAFGQPPMPGQQPGFGQYTTPNQPGVFGQPPMPGQQPGFGQYPAPNQPNTFGQPPMPGQQPGFGQYPTPNQPSTFGQPPMPGQQPGFGQYSAPNQPGQFGQPPMPGQQPGFGQYSAPNQPSTFGQPPMPGQQPGFGQYSAPNQPGVFGQPPMPGQQPGFGQYSAPNQPGVFGQPPMPGQQPGFGQYPAPNQPGVFGQPPMPGQQPGFGQPNTQGQQPGFGQPNMPGQQPGFGQPSAQGQQPGFGQPNVPGQQPGFGQPNMPGQQPGFGQPSAQGQQPGFGQPSTPGQQPRFGQPNTQGQQSAPTRKPNLDKQPASDKRLEIGKHPSGVQSAPGAPPASLGATPSGGQWEVPRQEFPPSNPAHSSANPNQAVPAWQAPPAPAKSNSTSRAPWLES